MEFATIREAVLHAASPSGDADEALVWHDFFIEHDDRPLAASALDRAYGLRPDDPHIVGLRQELLDSLAVEEFGIRFRFVPPGTFLMGSPHGDLDEQPVHEVLLDGFWMSETPVTWAKYCELMDWEPPPSGFPRHEEDALGVPDDKRESSFARHDANTAKIRRRYCDNQTSEEMNGRGRLPQEQRKYDRRPMVAVSWQQARDLGEQMTRLARGRQSSATFDLPTENQWEKAARGGLIQKEYPWGDEPPTHGICDFDHIDRLEVDVPTDFPPNGYGLHSMAGGVWEWVLDYYDALAYQHHDMSVTDENPANPSEYVLRGGSWLDCAAAMRVAFRMSRVSNEAAGNRPGHHTPGIGFRLCRTL